MKREKMVSVSLLTYNHEAYIRQCLDGILMQKVDFDYEIVVGDDCSSDGTRDIIQEYAKMYPDRFRLLFRKENLGVTKNLYDVLLHCEGKYIAGLEGDDYWTDENKLQLQVDFLETHQEYIGCGHEVRMIDEYDNEWYYSKKFLEGRHWTFNKSVYTFKDFERFNLPGQGSTYLYRNIFLNPKYDYSIIAKASPAVGDMTLLLITTAEGNWYFISGLTMTCYRYVITPGKENWASWIHTRNRCDIDFTYRLRLEQYARIVLKRKLDLTDQKFEMFHGALEWYRWGRNQKDWDIFRRIAGMAKPLSYYIKREIIVQAKRKVFLSTVAYAIKTGEIRTKDRILRRSSWKKFKKESKGKTIVAFGRGLGLDEFFEKYGSKYDVPCVIDNNAAYWNKEYEYYTSMKDYYRDRYWVADILNPEAVKEWDKNKFVVLITSTLYQDKMAEQLKSMGFYNYFSLGIMEIKKMRYRLFWRNLSEKGDKK